MTHSNLTVTLTQILDNIQNPEKSEDKSVFITLFNIMAVLIVKIDVAQ